MFSFCLSTLIHIFFLSFDLDFFLLFKFFVLSYLPALFLFFFLFYITFLALFSFFFLFYHLFTIYSEAFSFFPSFFLLFVCLSVFLSLNNIFFSFNLPFGLAGYCAAFPLAVQLQSGTQKVANNNFFWIKKVAKQNCVL